MASAYFASPWWLLTFDLVDVVEKQLYYSQSRDGIVTDAITTLGIIKLLLYYVYEVKSE